MNRQQAERKAMELYTKETNPLDTLITKLERAAFMQCFDLMPTGSLPMTREECKGWIEKKYEESGNFTWNASTLCLILYDHLASLSSVAPAPVGVTREADVLEKVLDFPLTNAEDRYNEGWNDGVNAVKCMVENEIGTGTAPVSSAAQPATGSDKVD